MGKSLLIAIFVSLATKLLFSATYITQDTDVSYLKKFR